MKKLFLLLLTILLSFVSIEAKGVVTHNPNSQNVILQGKIWWDKNLDGIQNETNTGIAGIKVHLYKNGEDTGEMVLTQNEGEGSYKFENLEADANYTIKVDLPLNYPDFTLKDKGNDSSKDSDIVNWVWRSATVYLKSGDTGYLDAGLVCKYCAQAHIEKYTNGILVNNPNEIPKLKVGSKVTWKYVVYNDSTKYSITDIKVVDDKEGTINCPKTSLEAGEYMECFKDGVVKEGPYENIATLTAKTPDGNITLSDEYPSNYIGVKSSIDLEKHTNGKDSDTAPGENLNIGDKVTWEYIVTNIGDTKLSNIKVVDDKEGPINCPKDSLDVNETMTCTKVGIVKKGPYENSATVSAVDENGEEVKDSDTSHYTGIISQCLGDFMWLDDNLNGIQDANELGVVDIKVDLYDDRGNFIKSTKTDNEGKYKFCGLSAGKYRVKFTQPPSYLFTIKDSGNNINDLKDSDVDSNGWSHIIDLKAGENDMSIDAGIYCSCDDYLVNPSHYKKVKAPASPYAAIILVLFIIIASSTLKDIKEK